MPSSSTLTPTTPTEHGGRRGKTEENRWHFVDALRGLALLNMLGMHFLYDVNVVFGRQPGWHLKPGVHIWQQYICWSFILIAGFAFRWGRRRNIKRGLTLNLFGFLITAVTLLAVPQEAIWFGILNFMGCAILLTVPLEKYLDRLPPLCGLGLSFLLFVLFYRVDSGVLGLGGLLSWKLPRALYTCRVLTPLGFPYPGFRSSDYFPLLPWLFLFFTGFYLFRLLEPLPAWRKLARVRIPLLYTVGRHTVWVYLLHQPLLMGLCMIIFRGEA